MPDRQIVVADTLSRQYEIEKTSADEINMTLQTEIKLNILYNSASLILDAIKKAQLENEACIAIKTKLPCERLKRMGINNNGTLICKYAMKDNTIYEQIVILEILQNQIIAEYHDTNGSCKSIEQTIKRIQRNYCWTNMK